LSTELMRAMKAELVPENGDPAIPIERDVTVVGRHESCDVVIDDASLSKRHCIFVKTDGLLVIRDLATTNGTKVKGQRVRWAALLPEDRISLGGYKLRIYLGSDEMPAPSEQRRGGSKSPKPPRSSEEFPRVIAGFPAPSNDELAAPPKPNADSSGANGIEDILAKAAAAESNAVGPGFEIIVDDDDAIIELD
jgi:pSer/pThr/pTyr-binding forkhead associated (FHA) protein